MAAGAQADAGHASGAEAGQCRDDDPGGIAVFEWEVDAVDGHGKQCAGVPDLVALQVTG
jgi:hypothetical protein